MPSTPGSPLLAALKLQQLQQQQKEAGKAIAEILRLLLRPWGLPHTLRALGPELKQADAKLVADFLFAHRLVTLDKYIQVGCSWRWCDRRRFPCLGPATWRPWESCSQTASRPRNCSWPLSGGACRG